MCLVSAAERCLSSVAASSSERRIIDGTNRTGNDACHGFCLFRPALYTLLYSHFYTFLTLTNSFKLFDQNLALTGGAPGVLSETSGTMIYQTQMMALNIYNTFYANQNSRGVGQAEAVIFFVIVVIIALAQLYFTRKREVQQ